MNAPNQIRAFAVQKTQTLLNDVVFAMHDAVRRHDAEAVHRLRVSIRRCQQALRLFGEFFPEAGVQKIREHLRDVMKAAGELRNLDVATELLEQETRVVPELRLNRVDAQRQLDEKLRRLTRKDMGVRWREAIRLK